MKRFFTSDTHFGHQNILTFCNRPFTDLEQMANLMIASINEQVSQEDELWILGDIAMGQIDITLPIVSRIHAKKIIVAGNHDRCHPYYGSKSVNWESGYLDLTKAVALHTQNLSLDLMGGTSVQVSHFPYPDTQTKVGKNSDDVAKKDKFAKYRPVDDGRWLICGHAHEKWRVKGRCINVGVDAWAGRAVTEEEIVNIIDQDPGDLPIIAWR